MFCMARIVCHLKFEAIATQSTLRVSGSHTGGAFVKNSPKITIQKKCPALSCGALNLADYLLSSAKYLMVLTIWLV